MDTTRRQRLRADTEEEIVAAARAILTGDGMPALTLRAIAARIGMTAPALYRYVDSRDEILRRMCTTIYDELADRLHAAIEVAGQAPIDRATAMMRAYRSWALDRTAEFTLVFTNSEPGVLGFWEPDRIAADPVYRAFIGVAADLLGETAGLEIAPGLGEAMTAADISRSEVRWAIGWWQRLHGAVMLEVHQRFPFTVGSGDAVFDAMLDDLAADIGRLRGDHG